MVSRKTAHHKEMKGYEKLKSNRHRATEYDRRITFDEELYSSSKLASTNLYMGSKISVLTGIFLQSSGHFVPTLSEQRKSLVSYSEQLDYSIYRQQHAWVV